MKYKKELLILFITAALVVSITVFSNLDIKIKPKGESAVNQQKNPNSQTQTEDSMADHHKPKPVDSKIFDNLVGKPAPDFTLESYDSKKINLSSLKGKNVILFFNEGLMCYPACWNQIAAFAKDTDLTSKNTIVLNINVDAKSDWKTAVDKMPELAAAEVLLDTDRAVSNLYGVLSLSSSMHRGQFPGHTYVIIDKEGVVRLARDDDQMAVRNKELTEEIVKL